MIGVSILSIATVVGCTSGRAVERIHQSDSSISLESRAKEKESLLRRPQHLQGDKRTTNIDDSSRSRRDVSRSLDDKVYYDRDPILSRTEVPWYNIKTDDAAAAAAGEIKREVTTTCQGEVFEGCENVNHMRPVACYPRDSTWYTTRSSCGKDPNEHQACASSVHLAPGHDMAKSITISYTIDHSCGSPSLQYDDDEDIYVLIGTDPNKLRRATTNVKRTIKQYNATSCLAEDPAECIEETKHYCTSKHFGLYISDWHVHDTIENGLEPDTTYYFATSVPTCPSLYTSVLSDDEGDTSFFNHGKRIFQFTTAPDQSNPDASLSIAVLADTEHTPDADITFQNVYQSSLKQPFAAMLIAGDLAYAYRDHRTWDRWLGVYEPLFSSTPFLITPGNHDQDNDCCDWTNYKAYENRFQMPQVQPAEMTPACQELTSGPNYNKGVYDYGNAFYSVVIGPVYIIVLNTYTSMKSHDPQYRWFKDEIKQVDRDETPWLFVMAHANLYETFKKHQDEDPQVKMKSQIEEFFAKYKVNFFISGHDHAYARTHPVYDGKVSTVGTSYVTIGNCGAPLQQDGLSHEEPWVASWDYQNFGYGTIHIHNRTHAEWETFFHRPGSSERIPNTDRAIILNSLYKDRISSMSDKD